MFLERKMVVDGQKVFFRYETPDHQELENFQVYVDNKRISADIVALNTEEGWVDIELPVLPQIDLNTMKPLKYEGNETFTRQLRRLTGSVVLRTK
jgi:hypothetical protein